MTMTLFLGTLGNKSCVSQEKKVSESTLKQNKAVVSNTPLSNAPITLVRPFAPQLALPKQRCPISE